MTKSEKLDILEHLRLRVEVSIVTGRYDGLCFFIMQSFFIIREEHGTVVLRELGIKKPFLAPKYGYWWALTERGMKKRLKAIDKAIEKLTND